MAHTGRGALYTPEMLALAVSLAEAPLDPSAPLVGQARSATCGSTVALGCALDDGGRITSIGVQAAACAVGQAATALFVNAAAGRTRDDIAEALAALDAWLAGEGELPGWPGLDAIAAARDYPARHGAVTLAWTAALDALSKDSRRS